MPETACREVWEETGIRITPDMLVDWKLSNRYEIFLQWRHRYAEGVTHNVEHLFSVCVPHDSVVHPLRRRALQRTLATLARSGRNLFLLEQPRRDLSAGASQPGQQASKRRKQAFQ